MATFASERLLLRCLNEDSVNGKHVVRFLKRIPQLFVSLRSHRGSGYSIFAGLDCVVLIPFHAMDRLEGKFHLLVAQVDTILGHNLCQIGLVWIFAMRNGVRKLPQAALDAGCSVNYSNRALGEPVQPMSHPNIKTI